MAVCSNEELRPPQVPGSELLAAAPAALPAPRAGPAAALRCPRLLAGGPRAAFGHRCPGVTGAAARCVGPGWPRSRRRRRSGSCHMMRFLESSWKAAFPLSAPAQPRRFSPAAGAVSPRPPDAAGSPNNLTAPPPGGGSGGPSPVPPSPGESPCRRSPPPGALRRFESRQPPAPLPVRRCRPPGWRLPAAGCSGSPRLGRGAPGCSQPPPPRQPSVPTELPRRRRLAAGRCRSLPFTRGRARTPLAGLLPPALVGPAPAASPGHRRTCARSPSRRRELLRGGRRGWALSKDSRACA
ncbi:formin-like protein 5 [Passer montanus]|uniref:formin-like protein 5 n=1 Tax=Passer montanus TaxID=9160 RepID=UPI0019610A42|nr:formin-like protein 5 [Passer montanus]